MNQTRITKTFDQLNVQNKTALIPYITAGDSSKELTLPLMHALVEAGADLIELGVPFSDPMADGPAIQLACERALKHKTSLKWVLETVAQFRKSNQQTPVILMGYLNPIEVMGYEAFALAASDAGVDGVITVDMPPEEADRLTREFEKHAIAPIFLLAPTSTDERIAQVCEQAKGFVYYVSLKGVTGSGALDLESVKTNVSRIKAHTDLPVGVGFGIKDAQTAKAMSALGDAVIVGSAITNLIGDMVDEPISDVVEGVKAFVGELKQAVE